MPYRLSDNLPSLALTGFGLGVLSFILANLDAMRGVLPDPEAEAALLSDRIEAAKRAEDEWTARTTEHQSALKLRDNALTAAFDVYNPARGLVVLAVQTLKGTEALQPVLKTCRAHSELKPVDVPKAMRALASSLAAHSKLLTRVKVTDALLAQLTDQAAVLEVELEAYSKADVARRAASDARDLARSELTEQIRFLEGSAEQALPKTAPGAMTTLRIHHLPHYSRAPASAAPAAPAAPLAAPSGGDEDPTGSGG